MLFFNEDAIECGGFTYDRKKMKTVTLPGFLSLTINMTEIRFSNYLHGIIGKVMKDL